MNKDTNIIAVIAREHLQNIGTILGIVMALILTIGMYYGYVHYLKASCEFAGTLTGSFGISITYLFFEKQNIFKKILYILLLIATSVYTGILMVHAGIISWLCAKKIKKVRIFPTFFISHKNAPRFFRESYSVFFQPYLSIQFSHN